MSTNFPFHKFVYAIQWERLSKPVPKSYPVNTIVVKVTFLTETGTQVECERYYLQWFGVCTSRIKRVLQFFRAHFPDHSVFHERVGQTKKILPYFEERLLSGKLEYRSKPFYKIYTDACLEDVGRLFHRYKVCYYLQQDWLVRLYIDLCTRHDTFSFRYKWYTVSSSKDLLRSFRMHPERKDMPDWTIGAFDIETVPMDGLRRVPKGLDPSDVIVMISLYKWNQRRGVCKYLFYLLPKTATPLEYADSYPYTSEKDMLYAFHACLQDCHVLTGYNIGRFDFPCLLARLVYLQQKDVLPHYSSARVGLDIVTTFQNKLVVDLYVYFKTFSAYDLPGFKLDDVAHVKLNEAKIHVKSTGLWNWYLCPPALSSSLIDNSNLETCFDRLEAYSTTPPSSLRIHQFGTFRTYMDYCLKDSELVYKLFQEEQVISFLVERANFTALDAVEALHLGNSRYLLELFKTYGMRLGFCFNAEFFRWSNVDVPVLPDLPVDAIIDSISVDTPMWLDPPVDTIVDPSSSDIVFLPPTTRKKRSTRKKGSSYQGALNFCKPGKYHNVTVMDFTSMYPSSMLSSNLCFGTCTIMTRKAWLETLSNQPACVTSLLTTIPHRTHSQEDFLQNDDEKPNGGAPSHGVSDKKFHGRVDDSEREPRDNSNESFAYPPWTERDPLVMVINPHAEAFLPSVIRHFLHQRKEHQRLAKETNNAYHKNVQLGIKILLNSLYGVMANKDSPLCCKTISMITVTLARYQLLASYHFIQRLGYEVCYADTDSLMVPSWPDLHCEPVNRYLNLPYVDLKYEQTMEHLLVLIKKRYVYETAVDGKVVTKGFQKKVNELVAFMSEVLLSSVWRRLFYSPTNVEKVSDEVMKKSYFADHKDWILWLQNLLATSFETLAKSKEAFSEKPEEMSMEKLNDTFFETPDENFLDRPDEICLNTFSETCLERPDDIFLDTCSETFLERPGELDICCETLLEGRQDETCLNVSLKISLNAFLERQKKNRRGYRKKIDPLVSLGWILWVEILLKAQYKCRDPKKYSLCRKTRHREDYKSNNCVAVRMLEKYPEKANDYIEYTYSQADVAASEASKWVMDADECEWVNFEQLFVHQKKIFCMLLNMTYWNGKYQPMVQCNYVLNTMRWKRFVHAELEHFMKTGKNLTILVERGVKYTFKLNDHVSRPRGTFIYKESGEKKRKLQNTRKRKPQNTRKEIQISLNP